MAERYAVYTRVSGSKGSKQDENFSRTLQAELCDRYGEYKGWEKYGEYHDSQTGTDYELRKDVQKVLNLLDKRLIQHVIFNVIDRIGRDMQVIERFITDIYELGGTVSVASSGATYETAESCIMDNFFEIAVADYERRKINKRTTDGRLQAFKMGSFSKRPPYGYLTYKETEIINGKKIALTKLKPDLHNSDSIVAILEKFAELRIKSRVVKWANDNALAHDGKPKTIWQLKTISQIISNADLYAGIPQKIKLYDLESKTYEKRYGKKLKVKENPEIEYTYPVITGVTRELAERVRIAKDIQDGKPNNLDSERPFKHLVYCSICGKRAAYQGHKNPQSSKFLCVSKSRNATEKSKGMSNRFHYDIHPYGINPKYFEIKLREYIAELNSENYLAELEIEIIEKYVRVIKINELLSDIDYEREKISEKRKAFTEKILSLDLESSADLVNTLNDAAKDMQHKLDELAEREIPLQKELSELSIILTRLDLPVNLEPVENPEWYEWNEQDGEYANILFEKLSKKMELVEYADFERVAISELRHTIRPRLTKVAKAVGNLTKALDARDWERVGYEMGFLGLRFYADFSEPERQTRRDNIRVIVKYDALEREKPLQGDLSITSSSTP